MAKRKIMVKKATGRTADKKHSSLRYVKLGGISRVVPKGIIREKIISETMIEKSIQDQHKKSMEEFNLKRIQNNTPIAKYDTETKRAYLEYPDGRIEY